MTPAAVRLRARIYDAAGKQIARISHRLSWGGRPDDYMIEFSEPVNEVLRFLAITTAVWVRSTTGPPGVYF